MGKSRSRRERDTEHAIAVQSVNRYYANRSTGRDTEPEPVTRFTHPYSNAVVGSLTERYNRDSERRVDRVNRNGSLYPDTCSVSLPKYAPRTYVYDADMFAETLLQNADRRTRIRQSSTAVRVNRIDALQREVDALRERQSLRESAVSRHMDGISEE